MPQYGMRYYYRYEIPGLLSQTIRRRAWFFFCGLIWDYKYGDRILTIWGWRYVRMTEVSADKKVCHFLLSKRLYP